jgi:hypothetical protein
MLAASEKAAFVERALWNIRSPADRPYSAWLVCSASRTHSSYLVVEPQAAEQFGELRFERFLADVFSAAGCRIALTLIARAALRSGACRWYRYER